MSRLVKTPEARARLRKLSAVLFALTACLAWWSVAVEGASPPRVIGAAAATVAALLEIFLPKRRRLLRKGTSGQEGA
jgi:hypothetical protein